MLYTALALGAVFILLPGLLPFLLGWALSRLLNSPVHLLERYLHLRRSWGSAIVLILCTALLVFLCLLLFDRLWYELSLLSTKLPLLIQWVRDLSRKLDDLIYQWTVAVSPQLRAAVQQLLTHGIQQAISLLSSLGTTGLAWLARMLTKLPRTVLFLVTALLACYFFLAGGPGLSAFLRQKIPPNRMAQLQHVSQQLKGALGGWLRVQGILFAVMFVLLTGGFFLIGVEPTLLPAAGIALVDALPVFGAGTILVPWSAICFFIGNRRRGIALLSLFVFLWLTRSLLQPKLIADRAGLHPLTALLSMYLGFSLFGVAGMLLAPLGAVLVQQLFRSGILKPK